MHMYDIIKKKRDKIELSEDEINFFIKNYTNGNIPDYQVSALLMAIYLNKMTEKETFYLTKAMVESGDSLDLSKIEGIKVDKHSTGGVGDSVTLILGPMVAACGVPFVKMSGRGLGHTGGTLDKLESIADFRVDLKEDDFINNTNKIGISLCSQTGNITPADKKIYELRDVTATVENLSLIASSIMSKKLALGSDKILLDVKVGSGAFMKNLDDATLLAEEMVAIGKNYNRQTKAIITNMNQPLGRAIGNSLEVKEAVDVLLNEGPEDIYNLCIELGSRLLIMAEKVKSIKEGKEMLIDVIESKKAYNKLIELVQMQGGDIEVIKDTNKLPTAKYIKEVKSIKEGYVKEINAEDIGRLSLKLGAGRETMDSKIDLSTGLILNKKIDDYVKKDEIICYIHANNKDIIKEVEKDILEIYVIGEKNKEEQKLLLAEIN